MARRIFRIRNLNQSLPLRTDPLNGRTEPRGVIFERLAAAGAEALFTTPYFGSDEAARLMSTAAHGGASVQLGVPGPNQWKNGQYAIHASRSYYDALEGVSILEFPMMSHAKANSIDGAGMLGATDGTGMSIVRALVHDELGGALRLSDEGGLRAEVTFPA